MSSSISRIDSSDYASKGASSLPDVPQLSADDLKRKFDEINLDLVIPKLNALIDYVNDLATIAETSGQVTVSQINAWTAKYDKPVDGIPLNDLSSEVQAAIAAGGGGGSGPISGTDAFINIQAPARSTVVITKGNVSDTLTGYVNANNPAVYNYFYTVLAADFDGENAWTITATKGTDTISKTVIINAAGEHDIVIPLRLWIVKDGIIQSDFTAYNEGGTLSIDTEEGCVIQHSAASGNSFSTIYFGPRIDVSGYNSLEIGRAHV